MLDMTCLSSIGADDGSEHPVDGVETGRFCLGRYAQASLGKVRF